MTNRQNWANRGVDPYKNMTWNEKLLEDAVEKLLAEVERLHEGIEHALHIRLRHGQEEGWKELKELIK